MLGWRLTISAILIPALVVVFYVDARSGPAAIPLYLLTVLIGTRCAWELAAMLEARFPEIDRRIGLAGVLAVITAAWWPHLPAFTAASYPGDEAAVGSAWQGGAAFTDSLGCIGLTFALAVMAVTLAEAARFRTPGDSLASAAVHLFIVAYVGVLLAVTSQLRWIAGAEAGYLVLGSVVIAAKMGDIGAYTLGRILGGRKMAPHLSPGKTWAGFAGALIGSALGALLWLQLATPRFHADWAPPVWVWSMTYGMLIGVAGLLGDLAESLIKRDVGCKDAAALFPGFGGLLDLLDSILFAGPAAVLLWHLLPLATWQAG